MRVEAFNPDDTPPLVNAGNCLRCGNRFVRFQLIMYVRPSQDAHGVAISVCGRCHGPAIPGYPHYDDSPVMLSRCHGTIDPMLAPEYVGSSPARGWAFFLGLADGTWRALLRDGHLHAYPPQVKDDPTFPWFDLRPEGLAYSTDGRHLVGSLAQFAAERTPAVPIVQIVPVDLAQPERPRAVGGETTETRDSYEFWTTRQLHYYETPMTPAMMRGIAGALIHLGAHPQVWTNAVWRYCSPERAARLRTDWPALLDGLELVLWQNDLWHAAVRGSDAFLDAPAHDECWPDGPQLWLFAQPYWVSETNTKERQAPFELPVPCVLDGCWVIPTFRLVDGGRRKVLLVGLVFTPLQVKPGELVPPPIIRFLPLILANDRMVWPVTDIEAASRFMRLPIAGREMHRLPRQQRRALEREGKPVIDIAVVILRREAPARDAQDRESDIEWSCHWLVKGHWRRQWHPSRGEHRPIYIDAHLKGDFEKPFRPPRQKLYVVAR